MQKSSLYITIGLLAAIVTGFYSCKKVNGISNNLVIETPYSLYFSDTSGAVYNSNDGSTYHIIFQPDGVPLRALCTSKSTIILIKNNLYYSTDNGKNFNISYDSLSRDTGRACDNFPVGLNQSMIMDVPNWTHPILYTLTRISSTTYGLVYSYQNGAINSWATDIFYDSLPASQGDFYAHTVSLTLMPDGVLASLAIDEPSLPTIRYRNLYRTDANGSGYWFWHECTGNPSGWPGIGEPINLSGTPLPNGGFFTLGHYNNQLIAIDRECGNGAWYSNDTGRNWAQFSGLPSAALLCICSPWEQTCLVGTDKGLYVLNVNTGVFQKNNNGLGDNIVVRSITYKENVLKNNATQKYVYLATNLGIYQSVDGGNNWTMTIPGNYTAIY